MCPRPTVCIWWSEVSSLGCLTSESMLLTPVPKSTCCQACCPSIAFLLPYRNLKLTCLNQGNMNHLKYISYLFLFNFCPSTRMSAPRRNGQWLVLHWFRSSQSSDWHIVGAQQRIVESHRTYHTLWTPFLPNISPAAGLHSGMAGRPPPLTTWPLQSHLSPFMLLGEVSASPSCTLETCRSVGNQS